MDRGAGARTWKGSQNPLREERRRGGDAVLASQVGSGDSERRNKGRDNFPEVSKSFGLSWTEFCANVWEKN